MLTAFVLLADPHVGLHERHFPVDPIYFGIGAFVVILLLLAVTFAFRSVGKRH